MAGREVLTADGGQRYHAGGQRDDGRDQRMRLRPVVNAVLVIFSTACRAPPGSRPITGPICPDCTAAAIRGPLWASPGTALTPVSTCVCTWLENRVPSRAMPVAMPT